VLGKLYFLSIVDFVGIDGTKEVVLEKGILVVMVLPPPYPNPFTLYSVVTNKR